MELLKLHCVYKAPQGLVKMQSLGSVGLGQSMRSCMSSNFWEMLMLPLVCGSHPEKQGFRRARVQHVTLAGGLIISRVQQMGGSALSNRSDSCVLPRNLL